jgi:hypothetical protein
MLNIVPAVWGAASQIPRPVYGSVGNLRLNACARPERLVNPGPERATRLPPTDLGPFRSLQNVQIGI